jgi:hypothetical protein
MSESVGSAYGLLIGGLKTALHIILLLLHNLIFIAIAVALLYATFRLGRHGAKRLRERWGTPEKSAPAAEQHQAALEQSLELSSSTIHESGSAPSQAFSDETGAMPESGQSVPQGEQAQEPSQAAGKGVR